MIPFYYCTMYTKSILVNISDESRNNTDLIRIWYSQPRAYIHETKVGKVHHHPTCSSCQSPQETAD